MGQTSPEKVDRLVALKYLKASETKALLKALEHSERNSEIFILLLSAYKKAFNQFPSPFNTVNCNNAKLDKQQQEKINKELSKYLGNIYANQLITDRQYNHHLQRINQNKYCHKVQLLEVLAAQQYYDEWMNPENVLAYSKQLFQYNLIADTSLQKIQSEIKEGTFTSHTHFYKHLKNLKYFDLSKYGDRPEQYLEQIHREIAGILPELSFSDFKYEIVTDSIWSTGDYISRNVIVSLKVNGKTYKQKSFIALDNFNDKGTYLGKIDETIFYGIFNKILSDNHSPIRLHCFGSRLPKNEDDLAYQYFGIIALEKRQTDMFRHPKSYIQVSYENYENGLTSSKIDSAISAFKDLGLFDHLTKEQIENSKEIVKEQGNQRLNDVLAVFPGVIYYFDTELANLENPYQELIEEYRKISHGAFNPESINDDFDFQKGKIATVTFTFNDKNYSKQLVIDGDWIDTAFFEFPKSVCRENNLPGQFYELYTGGQDAAIIYLSKNQYDYIRQHKLLLFGDEWPNEE